MSMVETRKKIIPATDVAQDVRGWEKEKKSPVRGEGSGDQGVALLQEPLLGLFQSRLVPVLEQLVVAPDGAVAIVDLDETPVTDASVDGLGQGEQDFHVESPKLHREKTPR